MDFAKYFPIWDKLTPAEQEKISSAAIYRSVSKGTILHNGSCVYCFRGRQRGYHLSFV